MASEFQAPTSQFPALPAGEVHIWCVSLCASPDQLAILFETLSEAEQKRAERFVFERDKNRFIVAHAALRYLISNYTKENRTDLQIDTTALGKPHIRLVNNNTRLHFNLSHSSDLAVLGFCQDGELGIDIERKRDEAATLDIAKNHFSERELAELQSLREPDRVAGFFRCWTRKEAYVKARGVGLGIDLRSFDVSLSSDDEAQLSSADANKWKVFSFTCQGDYWGALVYPISVRGIHLWSLFISKIL